MVDEFAKQLRVVGSDFRDIEGEKIVTGRGWKFPNDVIMPDMLFAKLLGSPYAHAKIKSIDYSAAMKEPGVKAVITADDNPNWSKTILYWGQEVAAVAAVDEATAERALDLIKVDYEVLPFILNPEEALKPGAILSGVFPDKNTGATPSMTTRGDVAKGFAEAEVILDEELPFFSKSHSMNGMEPPNAVAWWVGDHVYGFDANQGPISNNRSNAQIIGVPEARCHFRTASGVTGWGGMGQTLEAATCALLSKKAGLPVAHQRLQRYKSPSRRNHYSPRLKLKIGAKKDGTLTAISGTWWGDGGANGGAGGYWCWGDTLNCPNISIETWGVGTNKGISGGYR
jgi:CO/xanthine dehydrogenase Mo-binding subunit